MTIRRERARKWVQVSALVFLHLWILEGALRKWVPGTEMALYVGRDVLLVLCMALISVTYGRLREKAAWPFWVAVYLVIIWSCAQVIITGLGLPVAINGIRSYIAPLLLAYLVWSYQPRGLTMKVLRVVQFYVFVQAAISLLQVVSSPNSPINHEVGSEVAGFVNVGGVVRASGTFSAPIGLVYFLPLALACCLALYERTQGRSRVLALLASITVVANALASGSRGTLLAVVIVLGAYLMKRACASPGAGLRASLLLGSIGVIVYFAAVTFIPTVLESFSARFESASRSESTLDRIVFQSFGYLDYNLSLFGDGSGSRSQVGRALGSNLDWIEVDSTRWLAELGLLGLLMAILRTVTWILALVWAAVNIRKVGTLIFLIAAALLPVLAFGNVNQQPTAQGFAAICLALIASEFASGNARHSSTAHAVHVTSPAKAL